jgi:hypothetical protein
VAPGGSASYPRAKWSFHVITRPSPSRPYERGDRRCAVWYARYSAVVTVGSEALVCLRLFPPHLILVPLSSLSHSLVQSPRQTLAASPAAASPSPVLHQICSRLPAARERPTADERPSSLTAHDLLRSQPERGSCSSPTMSAASCFSPVMPWLRESTDRRQLQAKLGGGRTRQIKEEEGARDSG